MTRARAEAFIDVAETPGSPGRIRIGSLPATIGRSHDCDACIDDPYADLLHAELARGEAGLTLTDRGSLNGTEINGRLLQKNMPQALRPSDTVTIGQTFFTITDATSPQPAPLPLQRSGKVAQFFGTGGAATTVFALAVAAAAGWSYLETWSDDAGTEIAAAAAGMGGFVLIWAGIWAAAGRVLRARAAFAAQLSAASVFILASLAARCAQGYFDFLSGESKISAAAGVAINAATLGFLLYVATVIATRVRKNKAAAAALFLSLGLVGGVAVSDAVNASKFSPLPGYPATLRAYLGTAVPAQDAASFIAQTQDLFDDPRLNVAQKKKQ